MFEEGTRLKANYLQAEGAPPLFLDWFDTELGVECAFADVGFADRLVCFPTSPVGLGKNITFGAQVGSLFYKSFGSEQFALQETKSADGCRAQVQLFHLGSETESGYFERGAEIPLDSLVSGTPRPGKGSARIVDLEISASDGSVQRAGSVGRVETSTMAADYQVVVSRWVAWDKERSEVVSESLPSPVRGRWLPKVFPGDDLFSDAACSSSVAVATVCTPPRSLAYRGYDDCGDQTATLFETGTPSTDFGQLFEVDPDSEICTDYQLAPKAFDGTLRTVAPATLVPMTAFAATTEVRTGSGRLQLIEAATPGGEGAYPLGFWDTQLDQACAVSPLFVAADGSTRCLPDSIRLFDDDRGFYSDSSCSVSLAPRHSSPTFCGPMVTFASRHAPRPMAASPSDGLVPTRVHLFPFGDRYEGTAYAHALNGTCGATFAPEGVSLYTIEAELPPSGLATVNAVRND